MKYGDTLRQRSIPEWGHFNIDYDYLKDLIKHQTTPGTGVAVSIPGQGETTERAFGTTFFRVLKTQHDRINLFIKSKSGEIERRLEHISRTLEQLQARRPIDTPGARLPVRIVERYAKIDADVAKAGEEIRSLSRFQTAQRIGFYKILKKYKRWTKDPDLELRFKEEVEKPDSFFKLDLGYLLDQYIDVLGALRTAFDGSGGSSPSAKISRSLSAASQISKATDEGSEVDFDLAFSMLPLGSQGSKATYWVHPDHVVEVQVLLLQHMRLYTGPHARPPSTPRDSPFASPLRRKSSTNVDRYFGNEDTGGLLVLDHPDSFAFKRNASTVGSNEEATGSTGVRSAGNVRWAASGESAVIVGLEDNSEAVKVAKLKRKYIEAFLNLNAPFDYNQEMPSPENDLKAVRQWLTEHTEARPIAGVCAKRTRFIGLHNSQVGGTWATLDRDIFMKGNIQTALKNEEWVSDARSGAAVFPHAVLEVRREGHHFAGLIQTLDRSHLVERVRGFSLETHAVWACCKPGAMSAPSWMPLLDKDIRKLPEPVKRQRRRVPSSSASFTQISPQESASATSLTDGQTTPYTSKNGESSATSAPECVEPPPLHAFRKKSRRSSSHRPPPQPQAPPETPRYWNEYDNPESEDEGYYIYIDPNATIDFPGKQMFEALAQKTRALFGIKEVGEESPLLGTADDYSSDDDTESESPLVGPKSYGTMPSSGAQSDQGGYFSGLFRGLRDPRHDAEVQRRSERERSSLLDELQTRQHNAEVTKLRFYTTCLATSVVIDIILGIMTSTSRKKQRGVVDAVTLFGTIFTLLLCAAAIVSMQSRHERLGWLHQGAVVTAVGVVIAIDVLLLRWVLGG
ncbi:hypothetical protein BS50DRAFT_499556 [Corynespora cassiicola Philippines]|uniref:SPX domain-containing protein n=1 Tax=Corynespora cassiicola Philippines TaxID=1448308 RepID=A0A2T2NER9_CORCC|nr:hypothetical protein BS50DRAFT_499556 [Corynespora cassiicola Philippines]